MGKASIGLRAAVFATVTAMTLAACGGGDDGDTDEPGKDGDKAASGQEGGTLTFLTLADQILHLDPQRNYTREDLAYSSAYMNRTLNVFKM